MRDGHEDVHGAGDGQSDALSALQCERFGNKFSQDDERIRDSKKRQRRGKSVGINTGIWNVAEPWSDNRSQRAFAYPAKTKAGQGDAKLDRRKEFVEVLLNFADSTCADSALLNQLLDACVANADHGEFRGNEKGVSCHKENHQDDPEQDQSDHGLQSYTVAGFRQKG